MGAGRHAGRGALITGRLAAGLAAPLLATSLATLLGVAACRERVGAGAARAGGDDGAPEPGTEFYALAPEAVTEVTFSAPDRKLYAYRWASGTPFRLLVATRGDARAAECAAGPGFGRWLAAVSRLPIRGALPAGDPDSAGAWAELRLRDASTLDPAVVELRVPAADTAPVLARVGGRRYTTAVDGAVLRTAAAGCAVLGTAAPGGAAVPAR